MQARLIGSEEGQDAHVEQLQAVYSSAFGSNMCVTFMTYPRDMLGDAERCHRTRLLAEQQRLLVVRYCSSRRRYWSPPSGASTATGVDIWVVISCCGGRDIVICIAVSDREVQSYVLYVSASAE